MKTFRPISAMAALAVFVFGCGAQMRNVPIGTKNAQVSASIGGPIVDAFDMTVPLPYGMIGATYGLSDRAEIFIDFHATAAAFQFVGATPGAAYFPALKWSALVPGIGVDALVFSNLHESRVYPECTTSLAYPLRENWTPYFALRHTFQTGDRPNYIPSAMAGTSLRQGNRQYFLELQWLSFDQDNRWNPVDYHGISQRGALSLQMGFTLDIPLQKGPHK